MSLLIKKNKRKTICDCSFSPISGYLCSSVVVALSRTPLFYAYVLVPPSVWEKSDWSPRFGLNLGQDQVLLRLQLPVVPSEYLHDELTLREFIFR